MSITSKALPGTTWDPLYPESDGEPVGETDFHMLALILLRMDLENYFRPMPQVYVASDMFWYFAKGNPRAVRAPDVMVVMGVGKHKRVSFRTWEEDAIPRVIFEIVSDRTWEEDVGAKKLDYERLGVAEYFLFDPRACYISPALQGFRLLNGRYAPLGVGPDGSLTSAELGLRLLAEGEELRLVEGETGERILRAEERTELAEGRAEEEVQRAEEARHQAEQERRRAEQEKQRADTLRAELARLRAAQNKTNEP